MRFTRLRALREEAVRVRYRDVFLIPNFGRIIDIERTVLYLTTIGATLAIAESPRVIVPMVLLGAVGLACSATRLFRRRDRDIL